MPNGVFEVVQGFGPDSAGKFLPRHPGVDGITITGETSTGTAIMLATACWIRPLLFELGGKNAALVLADCDVGSSMEGILHAAFLNCSHIFFGNEKVYVERCMFERFVEALACGARTLRFDDPFGRTTTLGPLISVEHRGKMLSYCCQGVADCATVICGGGVPETQGSRSHGFWIRPSGSARPSNRASYAWKFLTPAATPVHLKTKRRLMTNDTRYGLGTCILPQNLDRTASPRALIDVCAKL